MKLDRRAFAPLVRNQHTQPVTPVTRPILPVLQPQASNDAAGNTVTPVTRLKPKTGSIQPAFQIRAAGKQFTMVILGGSTKDEALKEARSHWPDAEVL